jgi:Helix-turn-helix domain/Putative peptidoglycan binding domain/Lysozyme like domain
VQSAGVESFAAYLRMLKHRSGRGFDRLGKQAGVSSSSLHRYCSGTSVPPDYRVVHSFAKACGASPDELRQLHRLWAIADAERETDAATRPAAGPRPAAGSAGGGVRTAAVVRTPPTELPPEAVAGVADEPLDPPVAARAAAQVLPMTASVPLRTLAPPRGLARLSLARLGLARIRLARIGRHGRGAAVAAAAAGLLVLGATAWVVVDRAAGDDRPLFASACEPVVAMGEHSDCVWQVQTLLAAAGAKLAIDGDFGPETLRRVTAFQVLAGLPARGVVDDATKKALYAGGVDMKTWSAATVEKLIRDTFPEAPDVAFAIAKCQSRLDPMWISPNTDGTRNWGLFQISDRRLTDLDGTPRQAFDPTWNVRAARTLYDRRHDWKDWPHCASAARKADQ